MTVSVTPIDVGTTEGDGTGDKARTGAQSINSNGANFKAAIEELQGRHYTIQNGPTTVALGKRYMCNNHAAITLTLPATFAVSATDFSDLQIINADDASDVTITPASGDALFVDGATLTVDVSKVITPGNMVILSPRTTDSEWDLIIVGGGGSGGWADMTEAVWTGGTQSEIADGASAVAFEFDTDNEYSTAGAKLASWKNNGAEKAYITKDGTIVVPDGTAAVPSFAFAGDDQDCGFSKEASNTIILGLTGFDYYTFTTSGLTLQSGSSPLIKVANASATTATLCPNKSDTDTGVGSEPDRLYLIAGGIGGMSIDEGIDGTVGTHVFIKDLTTAPTGDPSGGGYMYVEAGALKYRGSSGTVTPIAVA